MDLYFCPKRIEKWNDGRLYELLGIRLFKKVCVFIAKQLRWESYFINDGSREGLRAYERRTRINEAIHSPLAMFLTYKMLSLLFEGSYVGAFIVAPIWILNVLPTLLQRYNRLRILKLLH